MAGSGDGSELPTVSGRGANREIGVASPYFHISYFYKESAI